tara:strand:- start:3443 stop:5134 length:1692 start_codon:yes stop_codon:yes gene_type:complete
MIPNWCIAIRMGWNLLFASCLLIFVSCKGNWYADGYHARADKEAFSILFEKTPQVRNVGANNVDLSLPADMELGRFPLGAGGGDFLGDYGAEERGGRILTLADALETGVTYGREYLNEKEIVFLAALDLTLARYRLEPMPFAQGSLELATDSRRADLNNIVSTNTFQRTGSVGFNWLYKTGARLSADFTRDFLRFTTGNRSINSSNLVVSLVQPLLQGGGTTVTMEALTQEERNMLYDLREFADFRRAFVVDVVGQYYGALQARDRVRNNFVAYQGLLENVRVEEALEDEGRSTLTQVGQLQQAVLQAESRWVNAIRSYQSQLDALKITLGVPVDVKILLDEDELIRLRIEDPGITREQAVKIAMVTRPDLATSADRVDDAERRIEVAKNGLLPGLDISLDYNPTSDPDDTTPAIDWDRRRWEGTLDLDLPLDRKAERNIYRATLLFLERAKRADELARDNAKLDIYNDWRTLDLAKLNFRIAEQEVALASRRLEEQLLLSELGRGEARDLVDAQNDLVNAQNERTATVVVHTLARLRLWKDMGILYIGDDGAWVERLENESP